MEKQITRTIAITKSLKEEINKLVKQDHCKFPTARSFVDYYLKIAIKKEKKK